MKKYLSEIFPNQKINNHQVTGIFDNSKKVIKGSIFIAIKGYKNDGNDYIQDAISKGALTIITDNSLTNKFSNSKINIIKTINAKATLARLLKWYYQDFPKPVLIGVTGTNGKTSVTSYVFNFLQNHNKNALLIGTEGNFANFENKITQHFTLNTTPSITTIYQLMYEKPYDYVIMEVSSQGICEKRVLGLDFDIVCFTNITQDHLDYHHTKEEYFLAKSILITNLPYSSTIILNKNMNYFNRLSALSIANYLTFAKDDEDSNLSGKIIKRSLDKMTINITEVDKEYLLDVKLVGDFNLENILASILIIKAVGFKMNEIINSFDKIVSVSGRMNVFKLKNFYVVVDFAHTPDGMSQVLTYLKQVKKNKLITVVGCGGNRDKTKRPIIGSIVTNNSDFVIITEDNSRNENINSIIEDIKKGIVKSNYKVIEDRKVAIDFAIKSACKDDIIVLLGKGNEQFIKKDILIEFSEIKYLESLGGARING